MTDVHPEPPAMASLTVRGIPEAEKEALRVRAAKNGRSMEAELRAIIHEVLQEERQPQTVGLGTAIHRRFAPYGGVDLPDHPDIPVREPPDFE
jgi:plasmid stability protein